MSTLKLPKLPRNRSREQARAWYEDVVWEFGLGVPSRVRQWTEGVMVASAFGEGDGIGKHPALTFAMKVKLQMATLCYCGIVNPQLA